MINRCRQCDRILHEGDPIKVTVTTVYRFLPSKVHFAIGKDIQDADSDSLQHIDCLAEEHDDTGLLGG